MKKNYETKDQIIYEKIKYYKDIPDIFYAKVIFSLDKISDYLKQKELFDTEEKTIFLSFNGGKDCLAAFILLKFYFFCIEKNLDYKDKESLLSFNSNEFILRNSKNFKFVYFIKKNYYSEEEIYVKEYISQENIELINIENDYISGLNFLIVNKNLKSIVMGTKVDDIKGQLKNENLIHPSTPPYPNFSRFYPVFYFEYEDIWRLILLSKTKYLELYDKGYSSIGNKFNTELNKNLMMNIENEQGENFSFYLPAFCLDQSLSNSERLYRNKDC